MATERVKMLPIAGNFRVVTTNSGCRLPFDIDIFSVASHCTFTGVYRIGGSSRLLDEGKENSAHLLDRGPILHIAAR